MLRIHYDFWNSRHDELLQATSSRLRPSSVLSVGETSQSAATGTVVQQKPEMVTEESSMKIGDFVFARWSSQPQAFPAKVLEALGEGITMIFHFHLQRCV